MNQKIIFRNIIKQCLKHYQIWYNISKQGKRGEKMDNEKINVLITEIEKDVQQTLQDSAIRDPAEINDMIYFSLDNIGGRENMNDSEFELFSNAAWLVLDKKFF